MKTFLDDKNRREILERIHGLTPASKRRWGAMTPHEMVCHLADSTRMALGIRPVASIGNVITRLSVFRMMALAPLPWPRGILQTAPEIDPAVRGTKPTGFEADVLELLCLLDEFTVADRRDWPDHPVMGRFSREDWGRQIYKHCDHHLVQFGV